MASNILSTFLNVLASLFLLSTSLILRNPLLNASDASCAVLAFINLSCQLTPPTLFHPLAPGDVPWGLAPLCSFHKNSSYSSNVGILSPNSSFQLCLRSLFHCAIPQWFLFPNSLAFGSAPDSVIIAPTTPAI